MMNFFLFCLLCGFYGVFGKDKDQKGKFSIPLLDVRSQQMVLEANQTLQLHCRGRWELSWAFPESLSEDQVEVDKSRCGRTTQHYCSSLRVSNSRAEHTGLYSCGYKHRTEKQASVYVYFTDSQQPFVESGGTGLNVLHMKIKQPLLIPCRVTNPNINTTLVKYRNRSMRADQRSIVWNSRRGFTLRSPSYFDVGLIFCQAVVDGVRYTSQTYYVHRIATNITKVSLNTTSPVQLLKGQKLVLNCTATTELNARVNITWNYPGKIHGAGSTSKRLVRHRMHLLFYSVLTIPKLQGSDRGLYTCHVSTGEQSKQETVSVTIYDHPFIRLKARNGSTMVAQAGQKAYRISPKLRAFPAPEIFWFKDGQLAAEHCSRYRTSGTSLIIRDVAEEDAGEYTVLVQMKEHALSQNLTLTLVVYVSPRIAEKAVSLPDPGSVLQGSRKALRCTSHGVPPPHFHWVWHPCPSKGLCVGPTSSSSSSSSLWRPVSESLAASSSHNYILSVTHSQEVLDGKKKTVGVLTVAKAFVSGVYRCIAANAAGTDHLDVPFYVTDVPGGFCVKQREEAREGSDLHLTCSANRHLYTALSWRRVNGKGESWAFPQYIPVPVAGNFSISLVLLLSNLTAGHSGTYRCSARHLFTGRESHLDTHVVVTTLKPPLLLKNLTDCSANVSTSVTLTCPSWGVPVPTITWYKDKQLLVKGSGIVVRRDGALHIDRLTKEDQGLYTCQATNERGSAETSAHIWVNSLSPSSMLEIPTLTCTCVVATLFWLLLILLIRKLKQSNRSNGKPSYLSIMLDAGERSLEHQCERLQYDPNRWEFPRERLKLGRSLGQGAFGKVMQGSAIGIGNIPSCKTVAVKMLKEGATASEQKALMTELKILNHIGNHLNVVNLLGACTKPGGPLMVIVEFCRFGNLSVFLKRKRDVYIQNWQTEGACESSSCGNSMSDEQNCISPLSGTDLHGNDLDSTLNSPLFLEDLISFSFQVARGMEFLASRKCIHRDLAARNVLLSDNKVVKICDFGLARDVYKDPDYVRKEDTRLPLKWMSPESIFDKVFTTQSDVWSFGILLWEIFSLGASPYPGLHIDENFFLRLKRGTRMRAPEYSTPEIYSIMLTCWEADPSNRPTFTNLVETLGNLLLVKVQQVGKIYIPFMSKTTGQQEAFNPLAVTNLSYMRSMTALQTFEEPLCKEQHTFDDDLSDSGMILPPEELECVRKSPGTSKLGRFFTFIKGQENHLSHTSSVIPNQQVNEHSIPPRS